MPDSQYPPTVKTGKIGVDFNTLGKVEHSAELPEEIQEHTDELLERYRLMSENVILNEKNLTKKIGVIRGENLVKGDNVPTDRWDIFAAMYTIGSNDGSCGITFETRKSPGSIVERMRIDTAGNVGIGTTTPEAGLHIDKASTNDVALKLSSNGPGWGSGIQLKNKDIKYGIYAGFGQFKICDANKNVDRLIIDAAGNVGIGTTIPSAKLEVSGDVKVTGDIFLTGGADCAEDFDIVGAESIEPGTVMVIDNNGSLRASEQAYDKRVAGVISGAGDYRPGITLDRQKARSNRLPIALTGKVYCKVDAEHSPVEVGDLLTTSSTIGHAMKADSRTKAFGAVIGKALHELEDGKGLIPILVALQ